MLQNFYVTFGMMYRYEQHPHWPSAHPDGWLWVQAEDEEAARALVARYIGNAYAFMYTGDRFDPKWHPLGCLAVISPAGATAVAEGVEAPTPLTVPPPTRTVTVTWYETSHYTAELDLPDGVDPEDEEALEALICDLPFERMDDAFTGTTERVITDKEVHS